MPPPDRDGTFVHVSGGRTARMAWVMFLLAGGEFEALLLGTVVLFTHPLETFARLQSEALPAAYLVASAAAAVTFSIVRARNAADPRRSRRAPTPRRRSPAGCGYRTAADRRRAFRRSRPHAPRRCGSWPAPHPARSRPGPTADADRGRG